MVKEYLLQLGYSKEEIKTILNSYPLCNLKKDTLLLKIKEVYYLLISLGYSHEDVIKMTKVLPSLFGLSIENIKQKITFLKQIDLDFIAVDDTKKLMQSIDSTYARYMFFKDRGIVINEENYRRLFYNAKQFEKQYGIDKTTLLERYNYQEYINIKKKY